MTDGKAPTTLGYRLYGLSIIAVALVALAYADFDPGHPVPKTFPARTTLAYAEAVFLLITGVAILHRRTTALAGEVLAAYYALIVVILMNGRIILRNLDVYGAYSGSAEQLAIGAGGLIIYATHARIDPALAARITRVGQIAFGVCALLFGGAHFVYMNLTAPLVPHFLPFGQVFWGHATGAAHIAGGLAILARVRARLAALLLTVMYASFTPFVHIPLLLADPASHGEWSENALNLALTAVAWVVWDSLKPPPSSRPICQQ
jgi:uncharacterized membrane protein